MEESPTLLLLGGKLYEGTQLSDNYKLVVCADSGSIHLATLRLEADLCVGDFDSSSPLSGVECIKFARDKDATDAELAIREILTRGCRKLVVVGATGGDQDHNLGNILLLASYCSRFSSIQILEGQASGVFLSDKMRIVLQGEIGSTFSIIPLTPTVTGVNVEGAKWPLSDATLYFGKTLTLRNQFASPEISVAVKTGTALIWILGHRVL